MRIHLNHIIKHNYFISFSFLSKLKENYKVDIFRITFIVMPILLSLDCLIWQSKLSITINEMDIYYLYFDVFPKIIHKNI